MENLNPAVTAYIAKSADFARPILDFLRKLIHNTCPGVKEDIKWGTPHYSYNGDHLVMMAGFKKHCSFSLYKAEMMKDKAIQDSIKEGRKFGYMDKLKDMSDLPAEKILVAYLKEAMAINARGISKPKPVKVNPVAAIEAPKEFMDALKKNKKALSVFESKSATFQKEYIKWIAEAKTDETRNKRIEQSIGWIEEGKGRFWQYQK